MTHFPQNRQKAEGRQSPAHNRLTAGGSWLLRFLLQISQRQKYNCGSVTATRLTMKCHLKARCKNTLALRRTNSTSSVLIGCPLDPALLNSYQNPQRPPVKAQKLRGWAHTLTNPSPSHFLREGLSQNMEAVNLKVSKPELLLSLPLHCWAQTQFSCGRWGLNSGPSACTATALPTG